MTTIKISQTLARELRQYDGGTYEENINTLLDNVGDKLTEEQEYYGITTIGVSDETKKRIKSFKKKPSESYEEILVRALKASQE